MLTTMLSRIFLPLLLAVMAASSQASANRVERFIVVVPVYRELYNQNIGTLLLSLAKQDLSGLGFSKIDVWLNVNNDHSVSSDVRIENQETVRFLSDLAEGRPVSINARHYVLRELLTKKISEKLVLHIIDQTTPGNPVRNIGKVRDFTARESLREFSDRRAEHVLVAQMDADASFDAGYVKSVVRTFEIENLKFALLDMSYSDQRDSEERVYQRKILSDFQIAAHSFRMARDGGMPSGGSPRIVTTGKALRLIGGVPQAMLGEDTELVTRLKSAYLGGGRYIDVSVEAGFRAREDGYDAAIYQRLLGEPIEFTSWMAESAALLPETEVYLKHFLGLETFYEEALAKNLEQHRRQIVRLRDYVRQMIAELRVGHELFQRGADFPAILDNAWFKEKLAGFTRENEDGIFQELSRQFPFYFADPPPLEIFLISRLKACTQTFLNRFFLKDAGTGFAMAPVFARRYPQTGNQIIDLKLEELEANWPQDFKFPKLESSLFQTLKLRLTFISTLQEIRTIPEFTLRADRLLLRMKTDIFFAIETDRRFFLGRTSELFEFTKITSLKIPDHTVRSLVATRRLELDNGKAVAEGEIRFISDMARLSESNPNRYQVYKMVEPLLTLGDDSGKEHSKIDRAENYLQRGLRCYDIFTTTGSLVAR